MIQIYRVSTAMTLVVHKFLLYGTQLIFFNNSQANSPASFSFYLPVWTKEVSPESSEVETPSGDREGMGTSREEQKLGSPGGLGAGRKESLIVAIRTNPGLIRVEEGSYSGDVSWSALFPWDRVSAVMAAIRSLRPDSPRPNGTHLRWNNRNRYTKLMPASVMMIMTIITGIYSVLICQVALLIITISHLSTAQRRIYFFYPQLSDKKIETWNWATFPGSPSYYGAEPKFTDWFDTEVHQDTIVMDSVINVLCELNSLVGS